MSQAELLETFNQLSETLQQQVLSYVNALIEQSAAEKSKSELAPNRGGFGIWKGRIKIAEDSDEPLEDFKDYME